MKKTLILADMPLNQLIEDACWIWNEVVNLKSRPPVTPFEKYLCTMLIFQTYHLDQLLRWRVGLPHNHYSNFCSGELFGRGAHHHTERPNHSTEKDKQFVLGYAAGISASTKPEEKKAD